MALPKVGGTAPAFSLLDQRGNKVTLKDFKNKNNVVLYFYPRAMTPGCTVQAQGVRDNQKTFARLATVVLAISPDSVKRLEKFCTRDALNFTLLADEDHQVAEKYGVWDLKKFMGKEFMGILRTTFIIGKDGKIKYVMNKVNTKTHHNDVVELIKEIDLK